MQHRATRPRSDSYAEIADRIIAALEAGVVPWHKPWDAATRGTLRG